MIGSPSFARASLKLEPTYVDVVLAALHVNTLQCTSVMEIQPQTEIETEVCTLTHRQRGMKERQGEAGNLSNDSKFVANCPASSRVVAAKR